LFVIQSFVIQLACDLVWFTSKCRQRKDDSALVIVNLLNKNNRVG
jgi:hypothetical protein